MKKIHLSRFALMARADAGTDCVVIIIATALLVARLAAALCILVSSTLSLVNQRATAYFPIPFLKNEQEAGVLGKHNG